MTRLSHAILSALTLCGLIGVGVATPAYASEGQWEKVSDKGGISISNRSRSGSDVKEVKAVGVIDAPPWVCKNVVDDVANYKHFMPYTDASELLTRGPGEVVTYQRVSAPLISNRDYTIRIRDLSRQLPDGSVIYKNAWSAANKLGPKPKSGVVRVEINEGYWQFEPAAGGSKTKATYYVYTDPGGSLPSFVVNGANQQAVPGLFAAVEKAANEEKYRKQKPALPAPEAEAPALSAPAASPSTPDTPGK